MDQQATKGLKPEFNTWPMNTTTEQRVEIIRRQFNELQDMVSLWTPPDNSRYLALVTTKLEEACMFTIKGFTKPV